MKKIAFTIALVLGVLTANAQIQKLAGPRIGITVLTYGTSADFINDRESFYDAAKDEEVFTEDQQIAFVSQYGWQWESRFADNGDMAGLVEWIVLVAGMEQGLFLPSVSSLVGMRTGNGFEVAGGPNLSVSGIGMVLTVGHNFKSGDLNFPVNIAFVPGKSSAWGGNDGPTGARVSLMLGFNMSK